MMKFDKFTIKVQEALMTARSLAQNNDNQQIEPIHLLISLIEQEDGITVPLYQKLGLNLDQLSRDLKIELNRIPKVTGVGATEVVLSQNASNLFNLAWKEADTLRDQFLSTEHIILALTQYELRPIKDIMIKYGITKDRIMQALASVRGIKRLQIKILKANIKQ
jgi:ATP-dependent Clp protease ATP-binding subunit ClpB